MTRTHVAESQAAVNGLNSIIHLKVTNIAHGLKMVQSQEMLDMAKVHCVTFDLGISSNYLTGVWTNKEWHPINKMLADGLRVTLGTDDPVQCCSSLDGEFKLTKQFGVTDDQRRQMQLIAEENTDRYVRASR